ncbi:hypothetical protein [Corallococcus sp. AS-1-6]|uniref:hypothetical protein n=1 Tax=Corallococcus sp. AS-1-6 TaxID=2874599 RepID=UPI001CBB40DF|nr:hypothetical protein [Corallococcus sp. AS-1-6]MBZ4370362.1 hypothetical protein [Corallococcus sp. AS-1-6]
MASLNTRARRLQRNTQRTFQQCITLLRRNAGQLSRLSTQTGWSIEECDDFLEKYGWTDVVDPDLDLQPSLHARYIEVARCDCGMPMLYATDKKGMLLTYNERPPTYCHRCRGGLDEEELFPCGKCGSGRVMHEDSWCEECEDDLDYMMNKDD